MTPINLEAIFAVVVMALVIYFVYTAESERSTFTVYMDKDSYWAIKAYRLAREDYHSTVLPKKGKRRVLKDLREKVPKEYYYLLDDESYHIAVLPNG